MPATQEQVFFAEVPHERGFGLKQIQGDGTGMTVDVAIDRNRVRPMIGEPYGATITVPLLDSEGTPTTTMRNLFVIGGSPRRVVLAGNRRLSEMGSPFVVGMVPVEGSTTTFPVLRRRP